jgi:hypothetical protein
MLTRAKTPSKLPGFLQAGQTLKLYSCDMKFTGAIGSMPSIERLHCGVCPGIGYR